MKTAKAASNYVVGAGYLLEPSKSHPTAYYWKVVTFEGEIYAEGDGTDDYREACRKMFANVQEMNDRANGAETP